MKESRLSIRISPDELEEIKRDASDAGMTLADYCLSAIREKRGIQPEAFDNISLHRRIKILENQIAALIGKAA
ncbi:MAG: hypothetical protein HC836_38005 [Richelia sp. RM2_1_2]|nr:hypothetical protein [Richelia sp. RM2_1_2]